MSADEYTPTTDEIRRGYAETIDALGGRHLGYSQFDRWLAQHEAEIRADQIEKDAEIAEEAPSDWATTYREFAADTIARAIARAIRAQPVSETTEGEK